MFWRSGAFAGPARDLFAAFGYSARLLTCAIPSGRIRAYHRVKCAQNIRLIAEQRGCIRLERLRSAKGFCVQCALRPGRMQCEPRIPWLRTWPFGPGDPALAGSIISGLSKCRLLVTPRPAASFATGTPVRLLPENSILHNHKYFVLCIEVTPSRRRAIVSTRGLGALSAP